MLDAKPKSKRRGNPDKYRDYMRHFMQQWRAKQKIKPKVPVALNTLLERDPGRM